MAFESFTGVWRLVAASSANDEAPFVGETEPDRQGLINWLNGVDDSLLAGATPASGLELTVHPDGTFSERVTGKPEVEWFDVEGVLQDSVIPFDGVIRAGAQAHFLYPAQPPKWSKAEEGRYGPAILRYDDTDTQVTDIIRRVGNQLVRTVNVVTDEAYLNRVVIVYERAG